jgi:hypothetical protein
VTSVEILQATIQQALGATQPYSCCLLIHHLRKPLDVAGYQLEKTWPAVSIAHVLSLALRDVSPRQRSRLVQPLLHAAFHPDTSTPTLLRDIDILFEPALELDPLHLLLGLSRSYPLVVLWPGGYQNNQLYYAVPEHAHYRFWHKPELPTRCIILLDQLR